MVFRVGQPELFSRLRHVIAFPPFNAGGLGAPVAAISIALSVSVAAISIALSFPVYNNVVFVR
jgi:hypothetical protein